MEHLITIKEACRITSLSRTTLWLKVKNNQFPKPKDLDCGRKAFLASEIDNWIKKLVASQRQAAPNTKGT